MQIGRNRLGATVGGDGMIYAIGGLDGASLSGNETAERFNESTQEWSYIASLPNKVRNLAAGTDNLGRVYAIGGVDFSNLSNPIYFDSVYRYNDVSNEWIAMASMTHARCGHAVTKDLQGRLYAIGGGTTTVFNSAERYDPNTDTWEEISPLNIARNSFAALTDSEGRIYAIGGCHGSGETSTVERYDPDQPGLGWQLVSPMSIARQTQGTVGPDGNFYICGGWCPGYTNLVEVYHPLTDAWSEYTPMNRSANGMGVVTGISGRIYVLGGDTGDPLVEYTDLDTPTPTPSGPTPTPTITPTGPIPTPTHTPMTSPTPTSEPTVMQESWEKVIEGFYEGQRVNLFHQSVALGSADSADMDQDGDLDLLVGGAHFIRYFRNDGTSTNPSWTLANPNLLEMASNGTYHMLVPRAADFDDDGDMDIVASSWLGNVFYYRNEGNMVFTKITDHFVPYYGMNTGLEVKDLDNDGDFDLLLSIGIGNPSPTEHTGKVFFFENIGGKTAPSFNAPVDLGLITNGQNTRRISLCDIDNDGDYDLFSSNAGYGTSLLGPPYRFEYYRNTGNADSFSFELVSSSYFPEISDQFWMSPTFLDADQDGDYDCLNFTMGEEGKGYYGFLENIGNPSVAQWKFGHGYFHTFTYANLNGIAAFGDLDGDGDLDAIQAGGRVAFGLFENVGSPVSANWKLIDSEYFPHSGRMSCPTLYDIDNDGDLDFFAIELPYWLDLGPRIHFWRNEGTAKSAAFNFESSGWQGIKSDGFPSADGMPVQFTSLSFGDVNGDNLPDLVVGTVHSKKIYLYLNSGTQSEASFDPDSPIELVTAAIPPGSYSNCLYSILEDVDLDGDLDLFVGTDGHYGQANYRARINFFRNRGTPSVYDFVLEDEEWAQPQIEYEPALSSGDIDGDGFPNIFVSDHNGGMEQYRCLLPKLQIIPPMVTLLSDLGASSISFTVTNANIPLDWALIENRSGASLLPSGTSCEYIAGATTGVIDVVEVVDASGTIGRAHVNVISATEMGQVGKAIIISGWKGTGDPLWPDTDRSATNYLANFAYRTLLHRGFSKENIYYLSPDPDQDVDGNGSNDDIDAESNLTNAQYAFNTWAGQSPAPTKLLVYLADHGGNQGIDQGYLRLNPGEVLLAQSVDAWLDALQTDHPSLQVTLAVDCCHSGSFLDECIAPAGKERIVLTSSKASEDAHFAAGGAISFSEAFFNSVYTGLSVGESFDHASGAMDRYQTAWLDDSGDGVWNKDEDGTLAADEVIGATFIAGADRPQIGKINANQTITSGTSATLWASEISSVYPLEEVFAVIVPPSFLPNPNQNPEQPITELPQLELTWNAGQNRYEGTYTDFTETGAYKIVIYARDIWDSYSYPKQTYVNQLGSTEKVIIVTGDTDYNAYSSWYYSNALSNYAYQTCRDRWIAKDRIRYLNGDMGQDVDGNGAADDIYGLPTLSNLEDAITVWAVDALKVTIYLVGQMTPDSFDVNSSEFLTSYQLDTWLDTLQASSPDKIVIVLEGDDSGSFIDDLTGTGRIIVTSCASPGSSLNQVYGLLSFSQFFWNQVLMGINVRDSYQFGRQAMRYLTSYQQQAKLDDGAGGSVAVGTWIGAAFVTGEEVPTIGEIPENVFVDSGSNMTLWASQVSDPDGIARVWALILPPDYDPSEDVIDEVTLTYQSANTRYEYDYAGLSEIGKYTLTFFAEDKVGDISQPKQTYLLYGMDEYEPDDASPEATFTTIPPMPVYQYHNFHDAGDTDWLRTYFFAGRDYWIETRNLEANCDLVLRLYNSSGPLTPPIDDNMGNTPEDIYYHASATDEYYVEVYHANSSIFGASTGYEIRISDTSPGNNGLATAIGEGQRSMKCEWDSVSGARGYNLYRSTHPDGPYTLKVNDSEIPEDGSDPVIYIDDECLDPLTIYFYRVKYVDFSGVEHEHGIPFSNVTGDGECDIPNAVVRWELY